ncbi:GNAT family N-acetyltransferase [Nocardia sp. alder85J]|uniref:GNAT family N-acetyltransferase n=1 Tax=Nocardia sp. alder85J TaxID=2862949 RepID=UPI001CD69716|nr:GNAT family N-acetyltransferase [Nocardia sp. alder85J]MCX4091231.1 GNAT family N-acetyltransferase [Nocardia sp. alder85J]
MPPEPTIRTAIPADYDAIITVVDDWWGRSVAPILPRLFLDHFAATSLIAESGSDLAGFLIGFLSPTEAGTAYIHFVGVHPDRRGTGLARTLYDRFISAAIADDRRRVCAITSPGNQGSAAFHRALGFTVRGPVTDYNGPDSPMLTFERAIGG